jgi:hypothetical protein
MPRVAEDPTSQFAFRLPASLIARLDAYARTMAEENRGLRVSRTDAVRIALTKGLDALGVPSSPPATKKRKARAR